eukprot:c16414_g1_i1.p1 GENE.c16414_g1_i1~~c16414_g1_i1.p1  ORF type:complete len:265 (-),score=78.85 c16414_g1_i1:28-822(-)
MGLANGDSLHRWRLDPFQIVENGVFYTPPQIPKESKSDRSHQSRDDHSSSRHTTGKRLSDREAQEFEDMLKTITVERKRIAAAMAFALDHADCSGEIVEITAESMSLADTPVPLKISRLYLISDILYNSSAPVRNASSYRSGFQSCLVSIFENIHKCFSSIESHIVRKAIQERVLMVLTTWERWSLYPPNFIENLRSTFETGQPQPTPAVPEADPQIDGDPLDDDEDVDGVPLDEEDLQRLSAQLQQLLPILPNQPTAPKKSRW